MIEFRAAAQSDNSDRGDTNKEKSKSSPGVEISSPEPSVIPTPAPDRIENSPEVEVPSRPLEINSPGMSPEINISDITEM